MGGVLTRPSDVCIVRFMGGWAARESKVNEVISTIRIMRAGYEGKLAACPHWDDEQREYLEAMIRQSHEDEALHAGTEG